MAARINDGAPVPGTVAPESDEAPALPGEKGFKKQGEAIGLGCAANERTVASARASSFCIEVRQEDGDAQLPRHVCAAVVGGVHGRPVLDAVKVGFESVRRDVRAQALLFRGAV